MTTEEMIAAMKAYEEGKKIEFYNRDSGKWELTKAPSWNWQYYNYRIFSEERQQKEKKAKEFIDSLIYPGATTVVYCENGSYDVYLRRTGSGWDELALINASKSYNITRVAANGDQLMITLIEKDYDTK